MNPQLPRLPLACLALLLSLLPLAAPSAAADDAEPAESGSRISLFNGENLQGWHQRGCKAAVEEGHLVIVEGDGLLRTDHRYGDFVLRWECRPRREAEWDSGIYFRCELPDEGPWPRQYQVNLRQGQEGELIGYRETRTAGRQLIKPGQWNAFELKVIGSTARLAINGQPAWKVDGIEQSEGYIAIQVEVPGGGQFEFRNLSVEEVGHRSLFNGADLSGWEGAGSEAEQCWKAADGMLICTGEKGPWLRSSEEFADFNLRLEYRLSDGGNSGVYVRVPKSGSHHGKDAGIEIQVLDDWAERYRELKPYQYAGSLYAIAPAEPRVSRPAGQWNTLEIDAQGDAYRITHNGVVVVEADAKSSPALTERLKAGYLGLQNHQSEVFFRNIRIREHRPSAAAEAAATE